METGQLHLPSAAGKATGLLRALLSSSLENFSPLLAEYGK